MQHIPDKDVGRFYLSSPLHEPEARSLSGRISRLEKGICSTHGEHQPIALAVKH